MIMVFAGRRNGRCALHVAGHAGYAPHGQDIVCAGVSALVDCLAAALYVFELKGAYADLQEGSARLTCAGSGVADVLFYQTALGLIGLARKHPECIRMRTEGFFAGDETGGMV